VLDTQCNVTEVGQRLGSFLRWVSVRGMKVVKEVILNLTKRNGRLNESQFTLRDRVSSRLVLSNVDFIPHLKEGKRLSVMWLR
jgi:hypothetical protein